jgi:ABC-type branched-chain amino acid transport systems, periplasmic component
MNDDTRAWTKRFVEKINGRLYPTMNHAGNYGGMLHYLKAVEAAQTTDGVKVVAKMKELPTKDVTFGAGRVREDGRHYSPDVPVAGEEAGREQGEVGLLQAGQDHPGRGRLAPARPRRLQPRRQEELITLFVPTSRARPKGLIAASASAGVDIGFLRFL